MNSPWFRVRTCGQLTWTVGKRAVCRSARNERTSGLVRDGRPVAAARAARATRRGTAGAPRRHVRPDPAPARTPDMLGSAPTHGGPSPDDHDPTEAGRLRAP